MAKISSAEVLSKFMDAIYGGVGLDALANLASDIIQNPVFVTDLSCRFIAVSDAVKKHDSHITPMLAAGGLSKDEHNRSRQNLYPILATKTGPFFAVRDNVSNILCPIRLRGEMVACITIMPLLHEFVDEDLETAAIIAKAITIELQKSRIFQDNRGTEYGYSLLEAITGDSVYRRNAASLLANWKHDEYMYIFSIVGTESTDYLDRTFHVLLRFLRTMLNQDIAVQTDSHIVLLISQKKPLRDDISKLEQIEEFLMLNHLHAGCSMQIQNLDNCYEHYREAIVAEQLRAFSSTNGLVSFYEDVSFFHILQIVGHKKRLQDLLYSGYITLCEYDRNYNTSYVETLKLYFDANKKLSVAAERMCIHKNTLVYRLGKIESILGADLSDTKVCFQLLVSLFISEYLENNEQAN